ncbi:unnamed protein product [Effrenium voratum]|nr:unnamed protein product [Effrenium voratum]
MLRKLALALTLSLAQGQTLLRNVAIGVNDANGTAIATGETPHSLFVGFTCVTGGTTTATVSLPSGLASTSGSLTIVGASPRRLEEEADEADLEGGRRLAVTCEAYGTASISGTTLTLPVRTIGTASDPCVAGSSLSVTLTANTATYNSVSTGSLAFSVVTNVDSAPVSVTISVDNSGTFSLSVVGDPITWYKGKKIKFWFPPQELMPLLQTPEMTIWARTFTGPSIDYQWFDRFMITSPEGKEIVDINVRRATPGANRSNFARDNFRQLDIKVQGTKTLLHRSQQLYSAGSGNVKVGVGARVVHPPRVHSSPLLEFVMVESESISFMVHASHAGSEFPGDAAKQVKYTHLDWITLEMPGMASFRGVLPQIWGVQPRQPEVEEMLVAPSQRKSMTVCEAESGPRSFGDLDFLDRRIVSNWLFMSKPNVTHVHQVLVSPTFLYVIMEYLDGPDLSQWLLSPEGQKRTEMSVMRMLHHILVAAREVHRHGFVHRDLKFDNFRFAHGPSSELKLVDVVGTMCFRPDRLISKSWCGTGPFLSPEALLGDVSPAVDMWAIGVMAFSLLHGDLPFQASSISELRDAHAQELPDAFGPTILPEAKALVKQLLQPDQEQRPTVDQALARLEGPRGCLERADATEALPLAKNHRIHNDSWSASPDLKPPEVKTLFLIRHGEAVHNIEERQAMQVAKSEAVNDGLTPSNREFQKRVEAARKKVLLDENLHDAALSPSGKMQALDALAVIKRLIMQGYAQPTAIYVSPLQRTLQTAAILFPAHPGIHVREELRERRTGLPCDERKRAEVVSMRATFNFMSFDELKNHDRSRRAPALAGQEEDKSELRCRTALLEALLREQADSSLAVVTHKGYLRELERGPLQNPEAKEFGNCEVRVYQADRSRGP